MVQSAFTIPHVTTFDEVDITALVALRARLKPRAEAAGAKLSLHALLDEGRDGGVPPLPTVQFVAG